MKAIPCVTALAALVGGIALHAQQPAEAKPAEPERIQVTFVDPEKFTDFTSEYLGRDSGREHLSEEFRKHIEWLGNQLLPEGQRLEVRFVDIDLAGDFEPWRGPQYDDIRIVKDLYPPRVDLEFRLLAADGSVVREGRRELRDLGFMMSTAMPQSDPLRHDKALLSDWMRREFKRPKK